jgi:hypothetical protein
MFSRLQLYILAGCILVAVGVFAIFSFNSKTQSTLPDAASSNNAGDSETTNNSVPAVNSRIETPLPNAYFKLSAQNHTDIQQGSTHQKIDANVELKYAHQKINDGIILTVYSLGMKMYQDGTLVEDTLITRDKLVQGNVESSFEDLSSEQQQMMTMSFATNLCKITLDANQNELGRQILSEIGFASINEGNVNTIRLMHGPYHSGQNDWQGVKRIPMTYGLVMDCPIDYARISADGNKISVNGSFTKDEVDSPQGGIAVKNVSCTVSGSETFDEKVGEYIAGELTLQYKFLAIQPGAQDAALDGKIKISLERVTSH